MSMPLRISSVFDREQASFRYLQFVNYETNTLQVYKTTPNYKSSRVI